MNRRLTAAGLVRRGIAASVAGPAMVAVVAALVTAVAVAGPRATTDVLAQDLHYRLGSAGPSTRDLQSSTEIAPFADDGSPVSITGTVADVPAALARTRAAMPATLRSVTQTGRYVGRNDGLAGRGIPATGPPQQLPRTTYDYSIEADPALRSDAVLVSGSWPAPVKSFDSAAPIQLVATVSAAKTFGWKIGQQQDMGELGTLVSRSVVLVGTIRPRHPAADYWQLDGSREHASRTTSVDGDHVTYFGTVWMDAGSWPRVSGSFAGATLRTWYPIVSGGIGVERVDALSASLHRFVSEPRTVGRGQANVQLRYTTGLGGIIDGYLARADAGAAVLSVVESGPIGTGAALLLLAILLLADRRRSAVLLLRARGASRWQFRVESGVHVALATVPGAIVGAVVAVAATAGSIGWWPYLAAVVVGLVPPVFAGAAAGSAPVALSRGGVARPGRWRWVIDATLVLLAVLAVVVLLARGLDGESGGGTDPLLAATPLVVSAGVCAIVLRVVPFVLRGLAPGIRRGTGVIGLVGRANSARAGARFLPVFAILAGLSVSIFAASILATEQAGIRDAAVNQIGADIGITGPGLPASAVKRLRTLDGVTDLAAIDAVGAVSLVGQRESVALYAVDAHDLDAVESVLPVDRRPFAALGTTVDGRSLAIGGGFSNHLRSVSRFAGSTSPPVATTRISGAVPKFIDGSPWLLIDAAATPKVTGLGHRITAVLIRVAGGTDQVVLQREIERIVGTTETVRVADTQERALTSAPLVGGLEVITLTAVIVSLLLCLFALLLTLVMGDRERGELLGRLRALGFSGRQAIGLVGWEIGPMAVLGIVVGSLVGIALPVVFLSVVDLSTFIGADVPPPVVIDPVFVGIAVIAFALSTVAAIGAAATVSARRRQ